MFIKAILILSTLLIHLTSAQAPCETGFFPITLTETCSGGVRQIICCSNRANRPRPCTDLAGVSGVECRGNTTTDTCYTNDRLCRRAECPGDTLPVPLLFSCANVETESTCCTAQTIPQTCRRFDGSAGIVCEGNMSATGERCFSADQFCPLTTNVNRNSYRTAVIVPSVLLGLFGAIGLLAGAASLIPLLASARSPRRAPAFRGYRPRYRARLPPRPVPQYVPGARVGPGFVPRP
ncbi:hypothetical protein ACOME3_000730 [Neoechinorhynchus agilis]